MRQILIDPKADSLYNLRTNRMKKAVFHGLYVLPADIKEFHEELDDLINKYHKRYRVEHDV